MQRIPTSAIKITHKHTPVLVQVLKMKKPPCCLIISIHSLQSVPQESSDLTSHDLCGTLSLLKLQVVRTRERLTLPNMAFPFFRAVVTMLKLLLFTVEAFWAFS